MASESVLKGLSCDNAGISLWSQLRCPLRRPGWGLGDEAGKFLPGGDVQPGPPPHLLFLEESRSFLRKAGVDLA